MLYGKRIYTILILILMVDMNADTTIITGYEKENELPDAPERPGYDFDSWNTAEDGSGTEL